MASGFLDKGKPVASGENKIVDLIKTEVIEYSGRFTKIRTTSRLSKGPRIGI